MQPVICVMLLNFSAYKIMNKKFFQRKCKDGINFVLLESGLASLFAKFELLKLKNAAQTGF